MITIGVEGKPGSGKSTLSRGLAEYQGVAHIEVDTIVEEIGLVRLRNIILGCANVLVKRALSGKGRYTRRIKNQEDNIHNKIGTPKILKLAKNVYFRIVSDAIKKQLKVCEENGVKIAVVDYALLNVSSIWHEFDFRVCVIKNEEERRKAIKNRDGVDENGIDFISLFSNFDIVQYGVGDVKCIQNNGDPEALKKKGKLLLAETIKSLSKKGINLCDKPSKTDEMER